MGQLGTGQREGAGEKGRELAEGDYGNLLFSIMRPSLFTNGWERVVTRS